MGQFTITNYGRSYKPNGDSQVRLPNMRMTFIKSNNKYYNPHTANGRVGSSCQSGNLRAIKRRT
jgi:hypothetical protein